MYSYANFVWSTKRTAKRYRRHVLACAAFQFRKAKKRVARIKKSTSESMRNYIIAVAVRSALDIKQREFFVPLHNNY